MLLVVDKLVVVVALALIMWSKARRGAARWWHWLLASVVWLCAVMTVVTYLAACTLHVVVEQRPVARVVPLDAPEQHPSLYGLPMTDAGPCGYAITSLAVNGCTSGTYYIDAAAQVIPVVRQANCENAGDVFEDCW